MSEVVRDAERTRAEILQRLKLLDSPPERDFDILAATAKRSLGVPVVTMSLVDADRLWFKAKCGVDLSAIPRKNSFCGTAVELDETLVIPDAQLDPRFSDNIMVKGGMGVRFYAGVPVRATSEQGHRVAIGTICIVDQEPRTISADDLESLHDYARLAEVLIEARASAVKASDLAQESHDIAVVLGREQQQFKQAERMASMGSWRLSLPDNALSWSDGVFAIHEMSPSDMLPVETAMEFYPAPDRELVGAAVAAAVEHGTPFELETDFITIKGNLRRVRLMGELERTGDETKGVIGVFQDITETHLLGRELLRLSRTDELTQMANRAEFNRVMDEAIIDARASGKPLAVMLIDLDGFKSVNDRFGHAAGDDLLRRIAAVFQAPYLDGCLAARLGGDEFAIVFKAPDDGAEVDSIIQRLLGAMRMTVEKEHGSLPVSGTIGVAWFDGSSIGRSELLRQADVALYSAKRRQRGTAETYHPGHRLLSAAN